MSRRSNEVDVHENNGDVITAVIYHASNVITVDIVR